ncbi:hypothetical protein HPB48_012060 [Haemaphysalis longicornis]|uniref:Uncharacterized protein n=1 Tax=Haemaphysalis longicornis TaxID=44386 RepID=A0A9J6H4T3_HAELO|nr:hypothetical protein HPB48_012060 [Haemaphysalis longicornis]
MVGDQVGRMVRRVSNKRGGLRSRDALLLANAFVTSRILYSTPYLRLRKCDVHTLEGILRKIYKRALDLPISTSNQPHAGLGGNEAADASARALDSRDPPRPPSLDDPEPNPISSFRDITAMN